MFGLVWDVVCVYSLDDVCWFGKDVWVDWLVYVRGLNRALNLSLSLSVYVSSLSSCLDKCMYILICIVSLSTHPCVMNVV
jgi:hypothetical protein